MVYTTYKNGALEDGLLLFYPHIYIYICISFGHAKQWRNAGCVRTTGHAILHCRRRITGWGKLVGCFTNGSSWSDSQKDCTTFEIQHDPPILTYFDIFGWCFLGRMFTFGWIQIHMFTWCLMLQSHHRAVFNPSDLAHLRVYHIIEHR